MKYVIDRIRDKSYLDPVTNCWVWEGADNGREKPEWCYGHIGVKEDGKWITRYVHRVAYQELVGPIPEGMKVLHTCDNTKCWNPDHLFLGTSKDNTQDMVAKNRHSKGEDRHNTKLTEDQVRELFRMYATGNYTQYELGATFGIVQPHVNKILSGGAWKHVSL